MEKRNRLPLFSRRLSELRIDHEMSLKEFADFIGLSRATIGFYEAGDRLPDAETIIAITTKCGVSADWLLGISEVKRQEDIKSNIELGLSQESIDSLRTLKGMNGLHLLEDFLNDSKYNDDMSQQELLSLVASGSLEMINYLVPFFASPNWGEKFIDIMIAHKHHKELPSCSDDELQQLKGKGIVPTGYSAFARLTAIDMAEEFSHIVEAYVELGAVSANAYIKKRKAEFTSSFKWAKRIVARVKRKNSKNDII